MYADVLQKRMQKAAQDTLENNKRGSWRLRAEPCLAAKRSLFTVRSEYWWSDGAKCYEVSKVIITQPEAYINVLVTSFQDLLSVQRGASAKPVVSSPPVDCILDHVLWEAPLSLQKCTFNCWDISGSKQTPDVFPDFSCLDWLLHILPDKLKEVL